MVKFCGQKILRARRRCPNQTFKRNDFLQMWTVWHDVLAGLITFGQISQSAILEYESYNMTFQDQVCYLEK